MQRPSRIRYVPGMISLVMLPILINIHIQQYTRHYKQHVIPIRVEDHRNDCYEAHIPNLSPMDGIWILRDYDANLKPIDFSKLLSLTQRAEMLGHKKDVYINEFYPFRFAKGTLLIVGISYLFLVYFAIRRL